MSPKTKRRLMYAAVTAGVIAAGAYGFGPVVAPVASRILTRVDQPRPAPPGPPPASVSPAPSTVLLSPEAQQLAAASVWKVDLVGFERRLERQRFRPLREYVMALEARIAELEGRCR